MESDRHENGTFHQKKVAAKAAVTIMIFLAVTLWAEAQNTDSLHISKTYPIDELVVTASRSRTDIRHLPMTVSVVGRGQIENGYKPSLLPALTEQIPGLFVTGRAVMGYGVSTGAAGGMTMRGVGGSPTTGMLVLVDGKPQYSGLMGHPIADACQSMLAEKVEVVRGPASVLYGGNAMGGVINIVTRTMEEDGLHADFRAGGGSFGTLQTEAAGGLKSGRWSTFATGSFSRTDGHRARMGFWQASGYVKAGYEIGDNWDATCDINVTHFDASNPGSVTAPVLDNDSRITRGAASVTLSNNFERTSGGVNLFYNFGRHNINDGYSPGGTPPDYRFNSFDLTAGLSLYQSIALRESNRLTVGADLQYFGGRAWNSFLSGVPDKQLSDKTMYNAAVYADFRQTIGQLLSLDAGLRVDRNSHVGTEWIPQAGLSFHPVGGITLKATVGKGFRFPTIREMYMFPTQNPDLRPERLMNYELSLGGRLPRMALSYGLNIFYIAGENIIIRIPVDGRPKNVNTGKIRNRGVECNVSWAIDLKWSVTANYSHLEMKYPVVAAPENKLYCGASYSSGKWHLSSGLQYVGGLYTSVEPVAKENFILWNATAAYRIGKNVELGLRGENLLSEHYEINAGYPMPRINIMGSITIKL